MMNGAGSVAPWQETHGPTRSFGCIPMCEAFIFPQHFEAMRVAAEFRTDMREYIRAAESVNQYVGVNSTHAQIPVISYPPEYKGAVPQWSTYPSRIDRVIAEAQESARVSRQDAEDAMQTAREALLYPAYCKICRGPCFYKDW